MWSERPIEGYLKGYLEAKLTPELAKRLTTRFDAAADLLSQKILEWIRATEPNLTDHGVSHIANVLDNAQRLLGLPDNYSENSECPLSPIELYVLCMAILFHDVGNLFGRDRHNQRIAEVYGAVFNGLWDEKEERRHVIQAGRAHCGITAEGSRDTLKELGTTPRYAYGQCIRLLPIAAIVRLADELAEGPQRTSDFLISKNLFDQTAMPYHAYASITKVNIDRGGERIALSYHITVNRCNDEASLNQELQRLQLLLDMAYTRVIKLDQERRYARHYCDVLAPFKATSVEVSFWDDNWTLEPTLPPLMLDDLVVPGESAKSVTDCYPNYAIDSIIQKVKGQIFSAGAHHDQPL